MDEAVKIADRICIMSEGRVVQYAPVEDIMRNPANTYVEEFIGVNRIWSSPEYIKAKDIMIRNPVCVSPGASVHLSSKKMLKSRVGSLLVVDSERKLLGLVKAKKLQLIDDQKQAVSNVMMQDCKKVSPDLNILEIMDIVNQSGISSVPVVDDKGILRGLITKTSLLATLSEQYNTNEVS